MLVVKLLIFKNDSKEFTHSTCLGVCVFQFLN